MKPSNVRFDPSTGLAPAIVQDAATRQVLMLGYVNAESLRLTMESGIVHFWSRSRNELWRKGDTSGNSFRLVEASVDCDSDAVLLLVDPAGPACHTGAVSCFDGDSTAPTAPEATSTGFEQLEALWAVISSRASALPAGSYTVELIRGGVEAAGRKVVEEATEVLLAAKDHAAGGDARRVHEEAADLVYHLFVLLAERGLEPGDMLRVLEERAN